MTWAIVRKIIKTWWKEIAVLVLLIAAFGTSIYHSNQAETAKTELAIVKTETAKQVAVAEEKVRQCTEVKQTYTNIFNSLGEIKSSIDNRIVQSQKKIDLMQKDREKIMLEMNKINLKGYTCEQKFDWMREQSLIGNEWEKKE